VLEKEVTRRRELEDQKKTRGVCHTMALPFTLKKSILKAKEEL
jgi:hypothetical protein